MVHRRGGPGRITVYMSRYRVNKFVLGQLLDTQLLRLFVQYRRNNYAPLGSVPKTVWADRRAVSGKNIPQLEKDGRLYYVNANVEYVFGFDQVYATAEDVQ